MTASQKSPAPGSGHWTVAGAKARLSEVIERAQTDPQIITRHGKPSVVIVSAEEWARKTVRKGSLAAFLAPPFTGLDTLPSLGVVLLSLAVLMEDVALAIAGVLVAAAGVALEIALGSAIVDGIGHVL